MCYQQSRRSQGSSSNVGGTLMTGKPAHTCLWPSGERSLCSRRQSQSLFGLGIMIWPPSQSPQLHVSSDNTCFSLSPGRPPSQAATLSPAYDSYASLTIDKDMAVILSQSNSLICTVLQIPPDSPLIQPQYPGDPILLACFADLPQREIARATDKLASEIKQDLQELGKLLESIESKVDDTSHSVPKF